MSDYWSSNTTDIATNLATAAKDPSVLTPDWEGGGRVHNWRNHVGEQAKRLWPTFSAEQKAALAFDADADAMDEEWE